MDALEIAAVLSDLRVGVELDRHCCPDADAKLSALDAAILAASEDPIWADGEPANLLAAGLDAYAWLSWLQQHARAFLMKQEDQERLDCCMVALRSFLRPNTERDAPSRGAGVPLAQSVFSLPRVVRGEGSPLARAVTDNTMKRERERERT
jgi:hypothetical protein